ncbi:DUF4835 family protein [Tenacibaculum sp. IB213877]|uniref:type IX secretion system protein PorD n=1 Tax=Tenacibaculum sp. IB213877 TaxID=3097351 RepID=UPI002A59E6EF|nr:DUF4835 family protein [Tenacibaculum sp. IB213877]MDY0779204.1 DUF4835 family protein [Tenacibaculum sp. IB213877]
MFLKNKIVSLLLVALFSISLNAQEELNAIVTINADKVQSSNKQVYSTLEKSLTEFINQTKWTNRKFLPQEKINCAFTIIVNEQAGNAFSATLQVQATRPVYKSSYETPILNINDTNFNFQYNEFEPLIYNPNLYDSNLVSTIVFYVYTILGVDADTFALKGGEPYLKQAESVMLQAQQSGETGWQNSIGKQNRFALIDNLLSSKFTTIRSVYYNYHRNGFDNFYQDENTAKKQILNSVLDLEKLHNITVGNYMIRVFLDAKSDEIANVFSDGKTTGQEEKMKEVLQKISPTQTDKWKRIKS